MAEDNRELLAFAREFANEGRDLYSYLKTDALAAKEDIHRAWRKASLKYHPDKAGDAFDPKEWERFERARDVLSDPEARKAYDAGIAAKLRVQQEREAKSREDRRFQDDLEAREKAHRDEQTAKIQRERDAMNNERERQAEQQRVRQEEKERQERAEQEFADIAEAKRRLKEKKEEKNRKRQEKEKAKAEAKVGKERGAANGVVLVPGDYMVDLGEVKKQYWELVCDKLRAVQAARNAGKEQGSEEAVREAVREAERGVQVARQRIHEAEAKFQQETTAI